MRPCPIHERRHSTPTYSNLEPRFPFCAWKQLPLFKLPHISEKFKVQMTSLDIQRLLLLKGPKICCVETTSFKTPLPFGTWCVAWLAPTIPAAHQIIHTVSDLVEPQPDVSFAPQRCGIRQSEALMSDDAARKASLKKDGATSAEDDRWEDMFRRLRVYYEQHGHCQVPVRWELDPVLGRFGM